jgi:hypothetical protein
MKLTRTILALSVATLAITPAPASAFSLSTNSIADTLSGLVETQKTSLFGLPIQKIASYIQTGGAVNMNTVFTDISKQAYELVKKSDGKDWMGNRTAALNQEKAEISHQGNTQSTAQNTKYFQDNLPKVQQVVKTNETASDSSLDAINKSNQLTATQVTTTQQLTKATLDVALAQQNRNSMDIAAGQQSATDRIHNQIDADFSRNEFERIQVVARRRFYKNPVTGEMEEGKADANTRVFYGKKPQ